MEQKNFSLAPNRDGTYDLCIWYGTLDYEFGRDFLSKNRQRKRAENAGEYLKENAGSEKISAVRLMAAGVMLASIPFAAFVGADSELDLNFGAGSYQNALNNLAAEKQADIQAERADSEVQM